MNYLDINSVGLDVSYFVIVPSGEELLATRVVRDRGLKLKVHTVYADIMMLLMPESDIILGMD